jgi:outer membrane protein assembly factor BamB
MRDGAVVAIDTANGATAWRSGIVAASAPAYFRGTLAVPAANALYFLDARNGRVKSARRMPGVIAVVSATSGFLAVRSIRNGGAAAAGYDARGSVRWKRVLPPIVNVELEALAGDAVALFDLGANTALVLDAANGNAVAQTSYVDGLIGADGRFLWFSVAGGGIKGLDLDTNRSIAVHGHVLPKGAVVEHGLAVAVIDGRLHVIDLATRTDRRLRIDGRWIGGPIAGKILVERGDGLYVQPIAENGKATQVARYDSPSRIVAADRAIAYVGLLDGEIFAIDMRKARAVQKASTPCRFYEGFTASGTTSIVHCDSDASHSQLVALSRAALL